MIREIAAKREKRVSHRRALFLLMHLRNVVVARKHFDDAYVTELLDEILQFLRKNDALLSEGVEHQHADAGKDGPLMRPEDWAILTEIGFL